MFPRDHASDQRAFRAQRIGTAEAGDLGEQQLQKLYRRAVFSGKIQQIAKNNRAFGNSKAKHDSNPTDHQKNVRHHLLRKNTADANGVRKYLAAEK